jgi:hypothetical protein
VGLVPNHVLLDPLYKQLALNVSPYLAEKIPLLLLRWYDGAGLMNVTFFRSPDPAERERDPY